MEPSKNRLNVTLWRIGRGLANLGISSVSDVRVGKHIQLTVEADSAEAARSVAEEAARKLLANQVMEHFEVSVA